MDEFKDEAKMKQLSDEQVEAFIMGSFVFAAVWSLGATTGNDGRKAFDVLFRELIAVRRARWDEVHAQHNGWTYVRTYSMGKSGTAIQWNLSITDTIETQPAVLYREVSLIPR